MGDMLWEHEHSLEYARLTQNADGFSFEGTIVLRLEGLPAKMAYHVACDQQWRTRHVRVEQQRGGKTDRLALDVDADGTWWSSEGVIPFAGGITDIDLEITPATNTIPLRRLNLAVGETAVVEAVWVRFPGLRLEKLVQHYTRLDAHHYHYRVPALPFEALLQVDDDGVIVRYGSLWRQV